MPEAQALDILLKCDCLFDIVVLGDVVGPYWIVDDDAINLVVFVRNSQLLLEVLLANSSQVEFKSTVTRGVSTRFRREDQSIGDG